MSSGYLHPAEAWPEFFTDAESDQVAFPSADADMTGFRLEDATPASFEDDIAAMVAASSRVSVREEPDPEPPGADWGLPDSEWP